MQDLMMALFYGFFAVSQSAVSNRVLCVIFLWLFSVAG
jgi:hypothetical protein